MPIFNVKLFSLPARQIPFIPQCIHSSEGLLLAAYRYLDWES